VLIGYARVSAVGQDTDLQVGALWRAGCDRVHHETMSGVVHRVELERSLYLLRAGDVLLVYKVDRLARSLADLLRIVGRIEAAGASFRSLTEPIDTGSPVGRMMLQLLGSFAEFERSVIRERCSAGRVAALARGVRFGRPPKIDLGELPSLVAAGLSAGEIAQIFACDRSSVAHAIRRCGLAPGHAIT
jgi:DNA invertase Pin-like site-specific DNA recombinase